MQEVLLTVHLKRASSDETRPVMPWVNAIADHKTIDAQRRRGREGRLVASAAGIGGGAIGATVFALYCPNDSVLFVAKRYGLGLAMTGALGAAVAARRLEW